MFERGAVRTRRPSLGPRKPELMLGKCSGRSNDEPSVAICDRTFASRLAGQGESSCQQHLLGFNGRDGSQHTIDHAPACSFA